MQREKNVELDFFLAGEQTWARAKIQLGESKIFQLGESNSKKSEGGVTKIQLEEWDLFLEFRVGTYSITSLNRA